MSKDKFSDYDSTAANNTDVGNIGIQGTNRVNGFDDALREVMSHIADNFASDTIASATTTDLGSKAAHYLTISGTTTITGLGTVKAGTLKFVRFSGALTLTHNGTSLILPGAANITTVAGDTAVFVSEGSGNWRCLDYKLVTPRQTTGWELIGTATPSGVSSVDFTGLSAYRMLRLTGRIAPATDDVIAYLTTSTNNGSSFDSGASDYPSLRTSFSAPNAASITAAALPGMALSITGVGNGGNELLNIDSAVLFDFNKSAICDYSFCTNYFNASGNAIRSITTGRRASTTARDAIRVAFTSGNISTGFLILEGVRG